MTYFLWELTRRPDIVKKLRTELDEAMPDPKVLSEIAVLNELPYLNAFMKEGLLAPFWVQLARANECMQVFDCTLLHRVFSSVLFRPRRRRAGSLTKYLT